MIIKTIVPQIPKFKYVSQKMKDCFDRQYLTNDGQNLLKFERMLQKYFNSKLKPVVFCNGELSLYSLIQAWKFNSNIKNCKAIVPSFTFSGTVNALVQNDIEPIFCDINNSLTLDLKKIKITKDVKFIIGASVYGNIPEINKIKKFAKKNRLIFILDNAPGFCSKINNKFPINFGVDEIYSFHATKIFNSIEGGCAITTNNNIRKLLVAARNFGQLKKGANDVLIPGLNSKMNELSAIVGIQNLKGIKNLVSNRKKVISKYLKFFKELENESKISCMKVNKNVFCSYFFFPIILKSDSVAKFLKYMASKRIYCRRYYTSVHTTTYYKQKIEAKDLKRIPFTEKIKNKIVALPIHSEMTNDQINYFFKNIRNFFK